MAPKTSLTLLISSCVVALLSASASSPTAIAADLPFPYDPLCAWGRLSNGKGFVIRCLNRDEAVRLGAPAASSSAAASAAPPGSSSAATPAPVAAGDLDVEFAAVTPDSGNDTFPEATASLMKGRDKYVACVRDHGGLEKDDAEVVVRFLIRDRGRAEGSSVKKSAGVTKDAAKCIADVVDRRFVGYPKGELVGASVAIKLKKKK